MRGAARVLNTDMEGQLAEETRALGPHRTRKVMVHLALAESVWAGEGRGVLKVVGPG
jgi:hypothetical protein